MNRKHLVIVAFVCAIMLSFASGVILSSAQGPQPQSPQVSLGTGFTYQGQLRNNGAPVNGSCDIAFRLYDAATSGTLLALPLTQTIAIANGLFTTQLDFGATTFNGDARWLDMRVRCPAGSGTFTLFDQRQALTAVPYAIALRGLRTEQATSSPNIIGGHSSNVADGFSNGSSILGGGNATNPNHIAGNYSVIAGGSNNQLLFSDDSFIGGGFSNTITAHEGVIVGGGNNVVSGDHAVILGGTQNQALGDDSTIGGGNKNVVTVAANNAVIGGGLGNLANGPYAVVPGGDQNHAYGYYSFAAGLGARALGNGTFVWADSVGVPFTSTATDQFIVRAAGGVGFGTNAPATQLHVVKSANGTATNPAENVVVFENPNTGNSADVLALKIGGTVNPATSNNFITFLLGNNTSVGAIQGNGSNSVELAGAGNDYAEYLPRLNVNETISAGDIVGVSNGHITKVTTDGATQVMVVSSSPIVVGNDPGEQARAAYERVAFIGQVSVRVRGSVRAGDLIVPSGANDGIGIAVAPEKISAAQFAQVVGQGWQSSDDADVKTMRVAVGLIRHDPTVQRLVENSTSQAEQLSSLEARIAALEHTKQASNMESSWLDVRTFVFGVLLAALVGYAVRRERKA